MIVAFILIAVAALLVFFLMLPLSVKITYLLYKEENCLKIKAGLIAPVFLIYENKTKSDEEIEKKSKKPDKKLIKRKINPELISDVFHEVSKLFSYFRKMLKVDRLKLHFHIGTNDAAKTGILTGTAWGILYDIAAVLDHKFSLKDKNIHVCPNFTKAVFETDIEVKMSVRIIYLLIFATKTYKSVKKLELI